MSKAGLVASSDGHHGPECNGSILASLDETDPLAGVRDRFIRSTQLNTDITNFPIGEIHTTILGLMKIDREQFSLLLTFRACRAPVAKRGHKIYGQNPRKISFLPTGSPIQDSSGSICMTPSSSSHHKWTLLIQLPLQPIFWVPSEISLPTWH